MSPPWDSCMLQARVAVIEREAPVESLVDLYLGPGEAETTRLLGDLEATTVPLHDIVIADDAFMHEAADPFETLWNGTPGGLLFARLTGEAAVVIRDELAQDGVGRVDVVCFGQPEFACETILEHSPEALDAACGLRAAMKVMPSCWRARPNWVGWRFPASCSSTVQLSSLRTKTPLRSP